MNKNTLLHPFRVSAKLHVVGTAETYSKKHLNDTQNNRHLHFHRVSETDLVLRQLPYLKMLTKSSGIYPLSKKDRTVFESKTAIMPKLLL